MRARPFVRSDLEVAERLWAELGGWYRQTTPVVDADVERALGELTTAYSGRAFWRTRRRYASGAWLVEEDDRPSGWLYARAEPEQSYVVPFVRLGEQEADALAALIEAATPWLLERGSARYVVDVPVDRRGIRQFFDARGRRLWRRTVLDRELTPNDLPRGTHASVREFRAGDLRKIRQLAEVRRPSPSAVPFPVPFFDLQATSWIPRRNEVNYASQVWVAGSNREVEGVAGASRRAGSVLGFLGPWILAETTATEIGPPLLAAVLGWLRRGGMGRVRLSLPPEPAVERDVLTAAGFCPVAESDLFEVVA